MSSPAPLADTPEPPYYAVIFTSLRTPDDDDGYGRTADEMVRLAALQPGYLGVESARGADGLGITVSYWRSEADIAAWKAVADHQAAQRAGKQKWYRGFRMRIAKVERAYSFAANEP